MPARSRARRRWPAAALPLALLLALAGCGALAGGGDVSQGELLIELADTINDLRAHDALLQEQLDSLHLVVARQDTLLARVAAAAGVPVPR